MNTEDQPEKLLETLRLYAGRWVALVDGQVVGQGGTPEQALAAARASRFRERPQILFVPQSQSFVFPPEFERLRAVLPEDIEVYLVGGAVRDLLLGQPVHDMDFVLVGDVMAIARHLANQLGSAFYPLDPERQIARLIFIRENQTRMVMDFALMRGSDLESDLYSRDFTLNAMALNVRDPQKLLDPLGGAVDLYEKRLRPCSSTSFQDDPVRILRAIRLAVAYSLKIAPEYRRMMHVAVEKLPQVSPERLRDELFRILEGPQPAVALRALEMLGALQYVLPELLPLKGLAQPLPHILEAWDHTLDVLNRLESLLAAFSPEYDPDKSTNLTLGLAVLRLGRYREQISEYLSTALTPERSLRSLLFFAALYHDVGKPQTRQIDKHGRIRFFGHDEVGARLVKERGQALHLSNEEILCLNRIVRHHMRPHLLAQSVNLPEPRVIYRFFRELGTAGVGVCLLALADTLATYGHTLPPEHWRHQLDVVRKLLEAWWEKPQEQVSPPALIDGRELIEHFHLKPGALIGKLLESVREAQAAGEVLTREQALQLVEKLLEEDSGQGKISSR